MKWKLLMCCFAVLFLCSGGEADTTGHIFAFSGLLSESDLIVTGLIVNVEIDPTTYRMTCGIEECIVGSAQEPLEIVSPLANGFYSSDDPYLEQDSRYLLFLKHDRDDLVITKRWGGVLNCDQRDDVVRIVQAYDSNPNLFSKEYSADLQDLFFAATQEDTRSRLLCDLEYCLTPADEPFLSTLLDSDNQRDNRFSILQCGRLGLESMRPRIEDLLGKTADSQIVFHCIAALGDLGNPDSLELVLGFLGDSEQGIRSAAIEAAGKIGGNVIIQPLSEWYASEQDFGNRLAIITSLSGVSDRNAVADALTYFLSVETDPIVLHALNRELDSLSALPRDSWGRVKSARTSAPAER